MPPFKNRLGETASPYLLQHADNPVHWFAWGEEALALARQLDRPILLSIGYAACHWCHVMAHESFENPHIAALMNQLFINIKVDREERPDIDHLYMSALHTLGEQGGWPLTMFLAPDATPFWGGTYFPPVGRYGRPGFPDVLKSVDQAWRERRFAVESTARKLAEALQAPSQAGTATLDRAVLELAAKRLSTVMDPDKGGTRGAPKFPNASLLELFERAHERSGEATYADIVDLTLEKLCLGGIYDHIGGGLCRYATDEDWLVPHFEKMLYDNAQLINLLSTAYSRSGNALFLRRIEETIAWTLRDLKVDRPAFAASLDADSGSGEGAFYVWTPEEIANVLGSEAGKFCALYDIAPGGNWENMSIPNLLRHPRSHIIAESLPTESLQRLNVSRETRPRPATDDKLLADWNAMTVSALTRASRHCNRPDWQRLALDLYRFIADSMLLVPDPHHSQRNSVASAPAMASDYATLAEAAITLYQAAPDQRLLDDCARCLDILHERYRHAPTGLYTLAQSAATDMPLHLPATTDEATPNLHASALGAMIALAHYSGDMTWLSRADDLFARLAAPALANPYGHAALLNALDLRLCAVAVVLLAQEHDPARQQFAAALSKLVPRKLFLTVINDGAKLPSGHPAHGKTTQGGRAAIYVCVGERCSLPVATPEEAVPLIRDMLAGL